MALAWSCPSLPWAVMATEAPDGNTRSGLQRVLEQLKS